MANSDTVSPRQFATPLFLGIDLGTSGVRAIVIDPSGTIVCQARTGYATSPMQATIINPQIWWQAVTRVLHQLQTSVPECISAIAAIAVDGTSSSVLISDNKGVPLTEALMYFDQRAAPQAALIREVAPEHHPASATASGLAKWLYLKDNINLSGRPDDIHLLHQADWIAGKLAGRFGFSDENNALKSGYDALKKSWPDWINVLITTPDTLPQVYPAGKVICQISATMADEFALNQDVLIVAGTTDSTAAVIATGASEVGDAVTSLGSTLVLKVINDKPVNDVTTGIYSQPFGNNWLVGGASNSGGAVLRQFFTDQQMLEYQQQINTTQPAKLDYYPLLAEGERFPVNDPHMVSRTTPRPDDDVLFFQGLLEGIANIEYLGYTKLQACGVPWPNSIRSTGGGSINPAWKAIRQKILKRPMLEVQQVEAAYGSAVLARRGWQKHMTEKTEAETSG